MTTTLNIPDLLHTETTNVGNDRIAFAKIEPDQDPLNPMEEDDSNGKLYSFSFKHRYYIGNNAEERIAELEQSPNVVKLGFFSHGHSVWFVSPDEEFAPPVTPGIEFRWDGRRYAGLWEADENAIENIDAIAKDQPDKPRRQIVVEYAAAVCEEYTKYINGQCYEYTVTVYDLLRDENGEIIDEEDHYEAHGNEVYRDASAGYYDEESLEHNIKNALEYGLQLNGKA